MAFTLKIKLTGQSQFTDFSNFVFAEPGGPLASKTFALNSIQQLDFVLKEASGFLPPERGNEVWLDCATYSPSGELFTGFIAADPEKVLFALEPDGSLRYKWRVTCQSEESMCNFTAPLYMSTLVPFQNKTVGQIVTYLLNLLAPGRFDTSGIQAGPVIPYYLPNAQANFTDIMKELVEGAGMKFWTRRKKAFLAYFDDAQVGVSALSTDPAFNPDDISITPYAQPIFNDVVGYGGEEPQVYVREYYSGDGLSMTFPLHLPAYGLTTTDLIIDDFNNSTLDLNRWVETDPTSAITEGASLFIGGGAGLNLTKVAAVQGLELAGTLFFQHGAVRFNSASSGIIGGLYTSPTAHTQANCLLGFRVVTNELNSFITPVVSGLTQGGDLDDFNRPNGGLGGNWVSVTGAFSVSGNEIYMSASGADNRATARWVASGSATYPPDQWAQLRLSVVTTNTGREIGPAVRVTPSADFYAFFAASDQTYLYKRFGATGLVNYAVVPRTPSAGDVLRISVVGGGLSGYVNGTLIATGFDPSPIVSGQPGVNAANFGSLTAPDPHGDGWQAGWMGGPGYGGLPTSGLTDYILQTQVQAPERVRRLRNFSSLQTPSGFGGQDVISNSFASMRVLAISQQDASSPPTAFELYNGTVSGAPTFVNYVPFNSENLNIAVNFLEVSSPMDVLAMNLPSGTTAFKTYTLGAQKEIDKDGSIVAQANQSTQNFQTLGSLGLFGLQAPSAGDIVEVRYRSAGQMVARVVEPSSLILEASRLGDGGERAGLLPQLNFAPRNQAELEFAIKSYIDDRDSPIFQGAYSFTTLRYVPPSEPIPGRFFTVNVSGTYPSFQAFANSVRTDITVESPSLPSGQAEIMDVEVTYGNLDKFQALMTQLSLQDQGGQSNINIRGVSLPASTDFALVSATTGPNLPDFRYAYQSAFVTNLLLQSQAIDTASWAKNQIQGIVPNTVLAPDGSLTAEACVPSGGATDSWFSQTVTGTTPGQPYTFSVYLKVPSGTNSLTLFMGTNGGGPSNFKAVTLTPAWQRFSFTLTTTGTGISSQVGGANTWVTGEVDTWGAQLESGLLASPYAPTLAATASRQRYVVDFGQAPPSGAGGDLGHFEVRYSDSNWGLPGTTNLISESVDQQVALGHTSRSQQYFARGVVPVNLALHSGFEDGINYLSASGANPPTGSYDATRGAGDFGCVKVVFPAGSTACSGSFTNCALTSLPSGLTLAGRVKFMSSRPLTGAEELRFKFAGTFNPTAETVLTSANVGSGTYSSFREFVIGPTTATPTGSTNSRLTVYVKSALTTPLTGWVDDVQVEKNPPSYAPNQYYKTTTRPKGYFSRYASLVELNFPLLPVVTGATVDYTDVGNPVVTLDPAVLLSPDLYGFTVVSANGTVRMITGGGLLSSDLIVVDSGNRTANLSYQIYAFNSLGEAGPVFSLAATIPPLANDGLAADSSALNLVPNGDLSVATDPTGIRCSRASAIRVQDGNTGPSPNGWTRNFESAGAGEGAAYRNLNFAGASFAGSPYIAVMQDTAIVSGVKFAYVCDAFAVRASVNYRFSASVWPNMGGTGLGGPNTLPLHATWYFRVLWYAVDATDFSRFSANFISFVDIVSNSTQNGPAFPFKIIQAPANAGFCRIAFYHWDDGTVASAWNMVFTSVRCTALLTAFDVTPVNTSGTFTGANPLSQSGATTTILVAASTMQFADGQIGYNSGSCAAAGLGTYYVYADDPTYSGGTVTYVATPTPSNTFANNGRIYFGVITLVGGGGAVGAGGGSGGGRISLR